MRSREENKEFELEIMELAKDHLQHVDPAAVESAASKLKDWLGKDGVRYFQLLDSFTGTVSPVLKLNMARKFMPAHPVHLREGMSVRNFLRELPECEGWDNHGHMMDDVWTTMVRKAIGR